MRELDADTLMFFDQHIDVLPLYQAFEAMLHDVQEQCEREKKAMDELKAQGKEKTATYRQYMGNRLMYSRILDLYKQYGILDS